MPEEGRELFPLDIWNGGGELNLLDSTRLGYIDVSDCRLIRGLM